MTDIFYTVGAELPDIDFIWHDSANVIIDFSIGWTFTFKLNTEPAFIKTTGITGAATAPNVIVSFAANELSTITPGIYAGQLWARRTADSKDRSPIPFRFVVGADIS
jgi:hypothetical protein